VKFAPWLQGACDPTSVTNTFFLRHKDSFVNTLFVKNAVFWDFMPCGSCKKVFDFVFLRSMRRLLVTANVPISPILVTLMTEALSSTRRNIPEDAILHSHRRENLKYCTLSVPLVHA
jgi:hypothetical protein